MFENIFGRKKVKNNILLVEDDALLAKVLSEYLLDHGFEVVVVKNGLDVFKSVKKHKPNLILLDIVMPIMDVWTMLQKLREENDWGAKVPVIVLTNLTSDDNVQISNIVKLKPSYFLVKSDWKMEDLMNKIKDRLADKTSE